jgi:hypothetical protein
MHEPEYAQHWQSQHRPGQLVEFQQAPTPEQ